MNILRLRAYYNPEAVAPSSMSDDMDGVYIKNRVININITPMPSRGVSEELRKQYKHRKNEELKGGCIVIRRFSMFREGNNPIQRAFRYLCCFIIEYFKGVNEKDIDLVHCGSTPPIQGLLGGIVAKRLSKKYGHKVPFVYNLQDIFPDSLVNAGLTKKGSIIWKIGKRIEDCTYRNADKIIVISKGFRDNLLNKGVLADKIEIVPNWVDTDMVRPISKNENKLFDELNINRDKFTVLYAGNIGEAQGTEIILEAAKQLQVNQSIQFVVFGGGSKFDEFTKKASNLSNMSVFSMMPSNRVAEVYSLGDVAIITCKKGMGGSAIPSKALSIMACNTPIIASFDTNSELNEFLKSAEAGLCVTPENTDALIKEINNRYSYWESGREKKIDSRKYVLDNASKDVCTKAYLDVLYSAMRE